MTPDGLPYVGPLTLLGDRVLVATGFAKWGMTNATVAAQILRDRLMSHENPLAATFDSNRFDPLAAGPSLLKENADVALHLVETASRRRARLRAWHPARVRSSRPARKRRAAFRDGQGELHLLSAACTHLGCEVRFNEAERLVGLPVSRLAVRRRRRPRARGSGGDRARARRRGPSMTVDDSVGQAAGADEHTTLEAASEERPVFGYAVLVATFGAVFGSALAGAARGNASPTASPAGTSSSPVSPPTS